MTDFRSAAKRSHGAIAFDSAVLWSLSFSNHFFFPVSQRKSRRKSDNSIVLIQKQPQETGTCSVLPCQDVHGVP